MRKRILSSVLSIVVLLTGINFSVVVNAIDSADSEKTIFEEYYKQKKEIEEQREKKRKKSKSDDDKLPKGYDQSVIDDINNNPIIIPGETLQVETMENTSEVIPNEISSSTYSVSTYSDFDSAFSIENFKVEPVNALFNYSNSDNEFVSLATGGINYNKKLLTLPGRNGIDFSLGVKYSSDDAVIRKSEYENLEEETLNFSHFAIGWKWDLPSITKDNSFYGYKNEFSVNLSDGSSYRLLLASDSEEETRTYKLRNCTDDITVTSLADDGGYILNYPDGTREYFDKTYGAITKREDRFGNQILYEYEDVDYIRATYVETLEKFTLNTKKLHILSRIVDDTGRAIDLNYVFDKTMFGDQLLKIELKVSDVVYATIEVGAEHCFNGNINTIKALVDGEGLKTKFDYNELISRIVVDGGDSDVLMVNSSAFMIEKITYPTGGYAEYKYERARRSYCYQPTPQRIHKWYEVFKVVSRTDSEGDVTTYEYDGDRSGYPNSYLVTSDWSDNPTGYIYHTGVEYKTIVKHNGITTIHVFDYKHNKVKEIEYDESYNCNTYTEGNNLISYEKKYGTPEWNVVINDELYDVGVYNKNLYIMSEDKFLTNIKFDFEVAAVKSCGDEIIIFCSKNNSNKILKIFNTANEEWEEDVYISNAFIFENIYYSLGNFVSFSIGNETIEVTSLDYYGKTRSSGSFEIEGRKNDAQFVCINNSKLYFKCKNILYEYDFKNKTVNSKVFTELNAEETILGFSLNGETYLCTNDYMYKLDYASGVMSVSYVYPFTSTQYQNVVKNGNGNVYFFSRYDESGYAPCIYKFTPNNIENPWELIAYRLYGNNTNVLMGHNQAFVLLGTNSHRRYEIINFEHNSLSSLCTITDYEYNDYLQIVSKKITKIDGNQKKLCSEEFWTYLERKKALESHTDVLGNLTLYEYIDSTYYIPTQITKYAETENSQITTFELSEDKKKVLSSISEYDSKSLKNQYTYDTIYTGNVIEESAYELVEDVSVLLNATEYEYDDNGLFAVQKKIKDVVTNSSEFAQSNIGDIVYNYTYNDFGLLLTETNPDNKTTSYTYNKNGWMTRTEYPDNTFVTKTYRLSDSVNKITTSYNNKYYTVDYFDGVGKCIIQSEKGSTSDEVVLNEYFYENGRLIGYSSAPDVTTTYFVQDGYGRTHSAYLNLANGTGTTLYADYDDYNMKETISMEGFAFSDDISTTTKYYDIAGRLIKTEQDSNAGMITIDYSYDYMGNLIQTTYPDGSSESSMYNDMGQLESVTDRAGRTTEYEYDSYGNLVKVTNPDDTEYQYEYDNIGRLLKTTDTMGTSEYYAYDNVGNVVSFKDKKAQVTNYTYDTMYRLLNKQSGDLQVGYTYDDMGNVLTMSDATGTTSYTYQYNNLCTSIKTPDDKTIRYTYHPGGNIKDVIDYEGNKTTYTYDGFDRIADVYKNNELLISYYYSIFGSLKEYYLYVDSPICSCSSYTYDNAGRLIMQSNAYENSETWAYAFDGTYTYDLMGNQLQKRETIIKGETDTGETLITNYTYDDIGRLTSETAPDGTVTSYTYNNSDNMTSKNVTHPTGFEYTYSQNGTEQTITDVTAHNYTYTYNNLDQLLSVNEQITGSSNFTSTDTYTYDANGNTLTKQTTGSAGPSSTQYSYNAWNQLTQFTAPDSTVTTYGYDGTGMRVSKTQGATVKKFYWDRGYISNESTNGAFTATNYIGGEGIFARETADDTDYMFRNGHGDIVASISEEDFTVTKTYDYDAYGVERNPSVSDNNPFRYCGEYYDEESGLIYLRNRYYDPSIGRFITEDPVKDGTNWYAYCGNNPVNFVDSLGLNGEPRYVIGDNVRIRNNPGTDSVVYGTLSKGTEVIYYGNKTEEIDGHMWAEVTIADTTGWVAATYLGIASPIMHNGGANLNYVDAQTIQIAFQSVGDYDKTSGLQCPDIVKWYVDTYTPYESARGNGCDQAVNTAMANELTTSETIIGVPSIFSVAPWVSGVLGSSGSKYGHTGIITAVDYVNGTVTYIHTWNSLAKKKPNSQISTKPIPTHSVTYTYIGD